MPFFMYVLVSDVFVTRPAFISKLITSQQALKPQGKTEQRAP
jgi:hypothetical protein